MEKLPYSFLLVAILFFLFPFTVSAQVVINEFYNTPKAAKGDWLELYSSTDVIISDWEIHDSTSFITTIPSGAIVGPSNQHYVVVLKDRLNKTSDTIKLFNASDKNNPVNQVSYGSGGDVCAPDESVHAIGRSPNGTGGFVRFASATEGKINNAVQDPCPTPTPTPTPSPTDTPTSVPESTTEATSAPTSSPSPTVIGKKTTRPRPTIKSSDDENSEDLVIGLREELETPEATEEAEEKGKVSWGAIVFIIVGIGFIGLAGFTFYTQKQKGYTGETENEKSE